MNPPAVPPGSPAPPPVAPAFASIPEAAAYTRLSVPTIRRAIRAGQLAAHKVGVRVLVAYLDLDAWIFGRPSP